MQKALLAGRKVQKVLKSEKSAKKLTKIQNAKKKREKSATSPTAPASFPLPIIAPCQQKTRLPFPLTTPFFLCKC